jgi:membrane protease YdiL (CAAX protease family)
VIVLSLIPYAVLTSAMMIAVCSVARSFKEAQNYVTPLIVLILVPAGVGIMQTVRLEGAMLVTPIANVTLFVRDLLQENTTFATAAVVLGSTTIYAAAAVAVATRLFGQEAVLFADAAPLKAMFARRFMRPRAAPSTAMALVTVAVLFPAVFVGQMGLHNLTGGDFAAFLKLLAVSHVALFVVLPAGLCAFNKIDVVSAFRLRVPPPRFWVAALMLGSSTALLSIAAIDYLTQGRPMPDDLVETGSAIAEAFKSLGLPMVLLLVAVAPALCEELLFRGFLLSGLATSTRKWGTILIVGVVFGAFHFALLRFPITAALGAILAYVCWQSRSVWPGMLVHVMHNGSFMLIAATANGQDSPVLRWLQDKSVLRVDSETQAIAIQRPALYAAAGVAVLALLLCYRRRDDRLTSPSAGH